MNKIFEVLENKAFDKISKALFTLDSGKGITLPVLQNVLIAQNSDFVTLTRSNMDRSLSFKIKKGTVCDFTGEKAFTVQSKELAERTAGLEGFELLQDGEKLFLRSESTTALQSPALFSEIMLPAEDFPIRPKVESPELFASVDAESFFEALKQGSVFASSEDTRAVLNGVFLEQVENELHFVATDGRRMFLKRIKTSRGTKGAFIIRKEEIETLCKVAKLCKVRGNIGIFKNSTGYCVAFSVGETVAIFSGKILEGVYPNYKQVIPRELENIVSINRDVLEKAVKAIKQFTPKPERGDLGISFRQHGRVFCAENFQGEVITELAPSEKELPAIDFQLVFFEEAIKNSKGAFKLAFSDAFSPALLKTETEFFILMPLRKPETNRRPAEPERQIENEPETVNA